MYNTFFTNHTFSHSHVDKIRKQKEPKTTIVAHVRKFKLNFGFF